LLHLLADPAPNHAPPRSQRLGDDANRRCHSTTIVTTIVVNTTRHIYGRAVAEVGRTSVGVYSSSATKFCLVPLKHSLPELKLLWPCYLGAWRAVSISNGTAANTFGRAAVRSFCAVHTVAAEAPPVDKQLVDVNGMHRTCSFEAPVACEDITVGAPVVISHDRKIGVRAEKQHTTRAVLADRHRPRRLQCCALGDGIAGAVQ
jgi:hypothetical protein